MASQVHVDVRGPDAAHLEALGPVLLVDHPVNRLSGAGWMIQSGPVKLVGPYPLAPTHQGEIRKIELDGSARWLCTGGSYLASSRSLELDTSFQGLGGMLSGESLSFMGR